MKINIPEKISISHIMWQPIFNCKIDCEDCYVKKSSTSRIKEVSKSLIDEIFFKRTLGCNQFTISLDTGNEYNPTLVALIKKLWDFYSKQIPCICENVTKFARIVDNQELPELCLTAYNIQTIENWAKACEMSLAEFLQPIFMLSLSNFPKKKNQAENIRTITSLTKTLLNFNKMAEEEFSLEELDNALLYSDQLYLVLKKPALGDKQSPQAVKHWIKLHKHINDSKYKEKLKSDACFEDAVGLIKNKEKCSAGLNKIHVWPGDIVTGCPYDSNKICNQPDKKIDLIDKIKLATMNKQCHSMNFCNIPKIIEKIIT